MEGSEWNFMSINPLLRDFLFHYLHHGFNEKWNKLLNMNKNIIAAL